MITLSAACLSLVLFLFIVKDATPPDPNSVEQAGDRALEVAEGDLENSFYFLQDRVTKHEITNDKAKLLLKERAGHFCDIIERTPVLTTNDYRFAEILRTAERFDQAAKYYQLAIEHEKANEARTINAKLRLAICDMHLDKFQDALTLVQSTFSCSKPLKGTILLSVYLDIAPLYNGQELEKDFAVLVHDAIGQHIDAEIDPDSMEGKRFLNARHHHLVKAWELAIQMIMDAGDAETAQKWARERDLTLRMYPSLTAKP